MTLKAFVLTLLSFECLLHWHLQIIIAFLSRKLLSKLHFFSNNFRILSNQKTFLSSSPLKLDKTNKARKTHENKAYFLREFLLLTEFVLYISLWASPKILASFFMELHLGYRMFISSFGKLTGVVTWRRAYLSKAYVNRYAGHDNYLS